MSDQLHSGFKLGAIAPTDAIFNSLPYVPGESILSSFICKDGSSDKKVMEENGESTWTSPNTVDQALHIWKKRHAK